MSIVLKSVKKQISEKDIEKYLRKSIIELGGEAYKFSSPARRGVPDRLCILPNGVSIFVECKRPGKFATALQIKEINKLRQLGQTAIVVSSYTEVDKLKQALMLKIARRNIK